MGREYQPPTEHPGPCDVEADQRFARLSSAEKFICAFGFCPNVMYTIEGESGREHGVGHVRGLGYGRCTQ